MKQSKKHYKVLIDDVWHRAAITKRDYSKIIECLNGLTSYDCDIRLENGEYVDVSFIEDIRVSA